MDICESSQVSSFECKDLQFNRFSDVELYSALKTLREKDNTDKKYQGRRKSFMSCFLLLEQINNGQCASEHKARVFAMKSRRLTLFHSFPILVASLTVKARSAQTQL